MPTPPVGPDAPIESIVVDGIRALRVAEGETSGTLQEILNRL